MHFKDQQYFLNILHADSNLIPSLLDTREIYPSLYLFLNLIFFRELLNSSSTKMKNISFIKLFECFSLFCCILRIMMTDFVKIDKIFV